MKFNKHLASALCALYIFSVIGIALSMHFCGGKLASVAVYSTKSACAICKTETQDKKDDGCCKNTKIDVKVKDSHQTETSFKLPKLFSLETLFSTSIRDAFKKITPFLFNRISNKAPPKPNSVAIHVFNCVFRN